MANPLDALKKKAKLGKKEPKPTPVETVEVDKDEEVKEEVTTSKKDKKSKLGKGKKEPKPTPVDTVEEDEDLDEDNEPSDDDQDQDDEDEIVKEKKSSKKKNSGKKSSKSSKEEDSSDDDEDDKPEEKTSAKGGLFSQKTTVSKERQVLETGDHMPRKDLYAHIASKLGCTNAEAERSLVSLENILLQDILPHYEITLLGGKFKRQEVPERIYQGIGGLVNIDRPKDAATSVSAHLKSTLSITFGRTRLRGTVNKKGKFIPDELEEVQEQEVVQETTKKKKKK